MNYVGGKYVMHYVVQDTFASGATFICFLKMDEAKVILDSLKSLNFGDSHASSFVLDEPYIRYD